MLDKPELTSSVGEKLSSKPLNSPSKKGSQRWKILAASLGAAGALLISFTGNSIAESDTNQAKIERAMLLLRQSNETKDLVDVRNQYNVQINFKDLSSVKNVPAGIWSSHTLGLSIVDLGLGLMNEDDDTVADALAHELRHIKTEKDGIYNQFDVKGACLQSELRSYKSQAFFWWDLHGPEGKTSESPLDRDFNYVSQSVIQHQDVWENKIALIYDGQCNYVASRFGPGLIALPVWVNQGLAPQPVMTPTKK